MGSGRRGASEQAPDAERAPGLPALCSTVVAGVQPIGAAWLEGAGATAPPAIERLFDLTAASASQVRSAAIDALVRLATRTPAVADAMPTHLTDARGRARLRATRVLGRIGATAASPGATERLLALTDERLPSLRALAVETLGAMGAAAATPAVIDRLLALTHDEDRGVHASNAP